MKTLKNYPETEELQKELLEELAPKINPAYNGWSDCVSDAKVSVYLRVIGLSREEAWKRIKELKIWAGYV